MTPSFTEASTTQAALVDRLSDDDMGWQHVRGCDLQRDLIDVLIEADVIEALVKLNPVIAEKPERVNEVLPSIRAAVLSVQDEGLVGANELMINWLRGLHSYQFNDLDQPEPIRLIDFDDPRANKLVVSGPKTGGNCLTDEVTFRAGEIERRYDVVLWCNGFPVVVGEAKTPTKWSVSWLNAARDINKTYEVETPGFFVPNVLSFATEGRELFYGPVAAPAEMWLPWGKTEEEPPLPGIARMIRMVELLLTPENVLEILRNYTMYAEISVGSGVKPIKIIPRYPQVEAVEAVIKRATDPQRKQGLIWHHQGSGKTFLMAFACGKLRRAMPGATIVVALDRLDLDEQVTSEFASAGVQKLDTAATRAELQQKIKEGQRGVIITTIYRFREAGLLTEREDVVVMVDEAHRTQEGLLGLDMRKALPNATYIGMTGTPISTADRDTFENFGDPDDPDWVLNKYGPERSIADGATLPFIVEAPRVDLQIDQEALDQAFDELAAEEGLTENEKELIARKVSRPATLLKSTKRIEAVCADIVDHYRDRILPFGMKAQVVAYDRELCVAYKVEIERQLELAGDEETEVEVVMTVQGKDDPLEWKEFARDRAAEAKLKARFKDVDDPLRIIIVTAKLLTGFDAPIEGVMYLDKPLRKHTLFQALTRTNRRWTNPHTDQEKTHGLIVDYIGLAQEIAASMNVTPKQWEQQYDADSLVTELKAALEKTLERFAGVDREAGGWQSLLAAHEKVPEPEDREDFAKEFLYVQSLFELLWPDEELREIRADYRWLAKVYQSIQPADTQNAILWHRVGVKTLRLVNEHIIVVETREGGTDTATIDEESLKALRELGIDDVGPDDEEDEEESGGKPVTPDKTEEILKSIEERIKKRMEAQPQNHAYTSLAARLDEIRKSAVETAADSIQFLKNLLDVAKDTVRADREAVEEAKEQGLDEVEAGLLPNEDRIGALTQILHEYGPEATPDIIERVVAEIDSVVVVTRFTGWQSSREGTRHVKKAIRQALLKFELDATGDLFDRAYTYVAEHY
jgi:type I restriction enzyme R subunit